MSTNYIVPTKVHNALVEAAYRYRGYTAEEAEAGARFSELTAWHGIKTHNAIKALHLTSCLVKAGGCVPGAKIQKLPSKLRPSKNGMPTASSARRRRSRRMDTAMKLGGPVWRRRRRGGQRVPLSVGRWVCDRRGQQGYIAYTACTAALAEVVPFGGKFPTLGTNPHSWDSRQKTSSDFPSASTGPPASSPWGACSSSSAKANNWRPVRCR